MNTSIEKNLVENESAPPVSVEPENQLIAMAMEKNMSVEVIEKLLDQKIRFEADEARKEFAAAMVKCQKEMPGIVAAVELEKSGYYAKLGQINAQITPVYTKYGFSVMFSEGVAANEGEIRTVGKLLHKSGHYEEFFCDLPLDLTGAQGTINKTKIHAKGSSNTYGERYIVKRMFNLSILSEDDDANANAAGSVAPLLITEDQALAIEVYCKENGLNFEPLFREFRIKGWEAIKAKDLDKVRKRIQTILAARK